MSASPRRVPKAYASAADRAPRGVRGGQVVADPQGDEVVVFIIGMRINRWHKVWSWWPVFTAMPRMLRELKREDRGLLGARTYWSGRVFMTVQYWRSAAELGTYARDGAMGHVPAWRAFNRQQAGTADVGIFHETYVVPRDRIESVYGNMPSFGLGEAHGAIDRGSAAYRSLANERMQTTEPEFVEA